MTEAEIRKYDPDDEGLKAVMGEQFHDNTHQAQSNPESAGRRKVAENTSKAVTDDTEGKRYLLHSIKSCVSVLGFSCLTLLIFFWQDAGLMAISVAEPSMCVCSALAGFSIGKFVRGWK